MKPIIVKMKPDNSQTSRSNFFTTKQRPMSLNRKCRVFIQNIPYRYKLQKIRDLINQKVGDLIYVRMYRNNLGKFNGSCTVTFKKLEDVKKAVLVLHHLIINNRKLVVYEDKDVRDSSGRQLLNNSGSTTEKTVFDLNNSYGLKPEFLESLNISPPLKNKVFITNLHPDVNEAKLEEIFALAGRLANVKLLKDGGYLRGIIEYKHPLYSVQAISMFNNYHLYNRPMVLRINRFENPFLEKLLSSKNKIGVGLGPNGVALFNLDDVCPDGYKFLDRPSQVDFDQNTPCESSSIGDSSGHTSQDDYQPKSVVMVENLSSKSTTVSLREHFRVCGDVKNICMSSGNTFKGCALVQFHSQAQAESAITLKHFTELDGQIIAVKLL